MQEWKLVAESWLASLPTGEEFTADRMIAAIGLQDDPTQGQNRNRVIGARMSAWAKAGEISFTGSFSRSKRPEGHGNRQPVWRKA